MLQCQRQTAILARMTAICSRRRVLRRRRVKLEQPASKPLYHLVSPTSLPPTPRLYDYIARSHDHCLIHSFVCLWRLSIHSIRALFDRHHRDCIASERALSSPDRHAVARAIPRSLGIGYYKYFHLPPSTSTTDIHFRSPWTRRPAARRVLLGTYQHALCG